MTEGDKDECEREERDGSTWWGIDAAEEEHTMGCGHAEWLGAEDMGNEAELELEIRIEMEMHMAKDTGAHNKNDSEVERQGKIRTRVRDRTAAGIEAGDGDGGGDDNGNDGGAKAKTGMGPGAEADGAARAEAKTGGREEARETEEGTADDEMIRACGVAEEQAAAEAVTEGNGANAKDGTEADDDVRSDIHDEGYGRQAEREGAGCGGKEGGKVRRNEKGR